ncbi:hypothetical protein IAQ61_007605, partial [Plenodomus lingam]|uniref:Predicted protein n=1 Tax=Leptosphaeria maculans (strain JN3 / isolate v23.1.3 / race Av1-4-5-6-7-8) TaxID=985895 RepID=E5A579_LEPMJ
MPADRDLCEHTIGTVNDSMAIGEDRSYLTESNHPRTPVSTRQPMQSSRPGLEIQGGIDRLSLLQHEARPIRLTKRISRKLMPIHLACAKQTLWLPFSQKAVTNTPARFASHIKTSPRSRRAWSDSDSKSASTILATKSASKHVWCCVIAHCPAA